MSGRFKTNLFVGHLSLSVCLIIPLVLLLGCDYLSTSSKYQIDIDDSNIGGINPIKKIIIAGHTKRAIEIVTKYFDISYKDTLHIYILDTKKFEGNRNRIYIDQSSYRDKHVIVHEVTHALLKLKGSNFEIEGLAVLMEYKSINNEKLIKKQYQTCALYPIQYLIENDRLFYSNPKVGNCVYKQAGLFYLFLDEKYGRKKMIEFYTQGIQNIESVYGVSLDSLDSAWQKWLYE